MRLFRLLTRVIMLGLFIIYVLFVVKTLFLGYRLFISGYDYNLIPFKTIAAYITRYEHYNYYTWFNNLFGNILLFIPLGFSGPYFLIKTRNFKLFVVLILIVIVSLEGLQMLLHLGSFDIDDVILNSFGGLIGFCIFTTCLTLVKKLIPIFNVVSGSKAS